MNPLTIIIAIIIALLGYPVGIIIAKFTKEELKAGKKWFKLIFVICFVAIIISLIFTKGNILLFLITSFIFILLIALASLIGAKKLYRKKLKRKKRKK